MKLLFSYLIFPGFLFAAVIGLLACWVDRKVSARLQWRVGPPWHQTFTDIVKLFGKETIIPVSAKFTFLLAPFLGLASLILVTAILGKSILLPLEGFSADLIVVLYLLTIPAISLIIGASSSANPLASVGASREMKMFLAYELPFLLSVISVIVKSAGSLQIGKILIQQSLFGSNIFSFSGALAFIVCLFCMQAKLGLNPFDASEADQEIMGGVLIEYSGLPLALFKITKAMLIYAMPVFLIVLFLGRDVSFLFLTLKFIALLVFMILVKNTNPRLRIDQAMRFFWRIPTVLALISVGLAVYGY